MRNMLVEKPFGSLQISNIIAHNILIDFIVLLPSNQTGPIPPSRDELPRTRR